MHLNIFFENFIVATSSFSKQTLKMLLLSLYDVVAFIFSFDYEDNFFTSLVITSLPAISLTPLKPIVRLGIIFLQKCFIQDPVMSCHGVYVFIKIILSMEISL